MLTDADFLTVILTELKLIMISFDEGESDRSYSNANIEEMLILML
jgi:hypothetical protein